MLIRSFYDLLRAVVKEAYLEQALNDAVIWHTRGTRRLLEWQVAYEDDPVILRETGWEPFAIDPEKGICYRRIR